MRYLRFTVDVEIDDDELITAQLINEVSDTLDGIIDNEYPAWVNYVRVLNEDDPEFDL